MENKDSVYHKFWGYLDKANDTYDTFVLNYHNKNYSDGVETYFHKKIATIVHLHYSELIPFCFEYISMIPPAIDIYITTSSISTLEIIDFHANRLNRANCHIIRKDNRGRDISSLLVTCRDIIAEYQYLCFIHDKKSATAEFDEDIEIWLNNMWDNMLKSTSYINNVIELLNNTQMGLLVPPKPYGKKVNYAFKNNWGINLENTNKLANELDISIIRENQNCDVLGTVFWCKTDALKKLFKKKWNYNDFPEEPLPGDGTISHSVERILPFVAQDAGFHVGYIMNSDYAAMQHIIMQKLLTISFDITRNTYGIDDIDKLLFFKKNMDECINYCKKHSEIYIYGAGKIGTYCRLFLEMNLIAIKGFIVSDKKDSRTEYRRVYQIDEVKKTKGMGIVIALNKKNREEVVHILKKYKLNDVFIYEFRARGIG